MRAAPTADAKASVARGKRTRAGGTYGDFVPDRNALPGMRDPSHGAEMEQDVRPANADFSRPPPATDVDALRSPHGPAPEASREDRIRAKAFARFEARDGAGGNAVDDWLAAEREVDAADLPELPTA